MLHRDAQNELNMAAAREAMAVHCQTSADRGKAEAVRSATAQIVGAAAYLEITIGRQRAMATIRELLVSI